MIFIRHHENCASKPNAAGRLTGECDCQTAKLDVAARTELEQFLAKHSEESVDADEESEYFALRLDELAELIAKEARNVRRDARSADREARRKRAAKRAAKQRSAA
jgi:hypothetical protein